MTRPYGSAGEAKHPTRSVALSFASPPARRGLRFFAARRAAQNDKREGLGVTTRMTRALCLLLLLLPAALGACRASSAQGASSAPLRLVPPDDEFFARAGFARPSPEEHQKARRFVVVGRFGPPGFAVAAPEELTLTTGSGRTVPLTIESATLVREFDRLIVSARLAFELDAETLAASGGALSLAWGPEVRAPNALVERLALVTQPETSWLTFIAESPRAGEETVASIVVIADSSAGWQFLWYLLPMALIVLLLVIRKAAAA